MCRFVECAEANRVCGGGGGASQRMPSFIWDILVVGEMWTWRKRFEVRVAVLIHKSDRDPI
ncbi:MAG: hypothetical protein N2112_08175 [Gemmataceae bacterium]|nr:hypothetical protein [Gemmataceae bacterium]